MAAHVVCPTEFVLYVVGDTLVSTTTTLNVQSKLDASVSHIVTDLRFHFDSLQRKNKNIPIVVSAAPASQLFLST